MVPNAKISLISRKPKKRYGVMVPNAKISIISRKPKER